MSPRGTARYLEAGLAQFPPTVRRAVAAAVELDFGFAVHPATGHLLAELARRCPSGGSVAETGLPRETLDLPRLEIVAEEPEPQPQSL